MSFLEAGVELLQEGRLLGRDLDDLLGVPGLQRQPALDPGAEPVASGLEPVAPRWRPLRIFWIVIAETRVPSSASIASWRLQP
jgi:hypothetical protein